jgi:hypothetical protein
VAHPASAHWMHHLEVRDVAEIDDEMAAWPREAAELASWFRKRAWDGGGGLAPA